jgi:hypothetical protein
MGIDAHRAPLQALHSQNVAARLRPSLTGPEAVTQGKANEEAPRSASASTLTERRYKRCIRKM